MSRLLAFYRGERTDAQGRFLKDIWAWHDYDLEAVHDFIQWLFPLPEPSRFNSDAPVLTEEDIAAFRNDPILQANLMKSFLRILSYLGFSLADDGKVVESATFPAQIPYLWAKSNHNWRRITRILRSLTLLGMQEHAQALYNRLATYYQNRRFPIPEETYRYWADAVKLARQ